MVARLLLLGGICWLIGMWFEMFRGGLRGDIAIAMNYIGGSLSLVGGVLIAAGVLVRVLGG